MTNLTLLGISSYFTENASTGGGGGSPVIINSTAGAIVNGGTTTAASIVVSSNPNLALVAFVLDRFSVAISTVAYTAGTGGAWTRFATASSAAVRADVWWSIPDAGSATVTATLAGTITDDCNIIVFSCYNVDQATPLEAYTSSTVSTLAVPVSANGMAISQYIASGNPGAITVGVLDYDNVNNEFWKGAHNSTTPTGTMAYTSNSGARYFHGVCVRAA